MNELLRESILKVVNVGGPIKYTTLALSVMDYVNPAKFDKELFDNELNDLVLSQDIIEIRYNVDGRIHSMYAKKSTEVILV